MFDPTGNAGGNFAGATTETRGAFVYGAGADYAFTRHISLRAEYRGYLYKAPDFNLTRLNTDSWTHIAQPSDGIVFVFNQPRPKAWYGCLVEHPCHLQQGDDASLSSLQKSRLPSVR